MTNFLLDEGAVTSFIQNITDYAIVFLDVNGHVAAWNRGANLLKGYEAHEVLGTHFSRFYTMEAQAVGHPERELAIAAAVGRYEEEGWRVRKDSSRFWAHVVINAIYDRRGGLAGYGKIVRDFTDRKQSVEQSANVLNLLELTARTDYLTGLDNRRSMDKAVLAALSAARRREHCMCLAMIDLDRFKRFNDEYGHQAGDAFLKAASAAWRRNLRPEDMLARYGGEEFVLVLPDTDLDGAMLCLDRIRSATPPPLTCSIGLAESDGTETPSQLLGRADQAMYEAKSAGRNRLVAVTMATPAPPQLILEDARSAVKLPLGQPTLDPL